MQSGIYILINKKTDKCYIGSTINFKQRWQNHRARLQRGVHDNPYLQHSWDKYGKESFEFGILEYLDNPKELHLAEQFWMDIYRLEEKQLYNCGLCATSPRLGCFASDKTKRKIGTAFAKAYPALINVKTGKKIPEGINISALNRKYGFCKNGIYNMLSGKVLQYKGWVVDAPGAIDTFVTAHKEIYRQLSLIRRGFTGHKHTEETRQKISGSRKGKHFSLETRQKMSDAHSKTYPTLTHRNTGEIISAGSNLLALCHGRKLNYTGMWRLVRGKQVQYKGWTILTSETKD